MQDQIIVDVNNPFNTSPRQTTRVIFESLPDCDLQLPAYATEHSAGIDFSACLKRPCQRIKEGVKYAADIKTNAAGKMYLDLYPKNMYLISLGHKSEFPPGYVMLLCIRSSLGTKGLMLGNSVGVLDADYRGEIFACITNTETNVVRIEHGQRIVQGLLMPCIMAEIFGGIVSDTARGEGGFGSTGTK